MTPISMLLAQLGEDDVTKQVLLDLFVQIAAKPCFHELRTQQRLGYSVSLYAHELHRILGLAIRVQSPTATPDVLQQRIDAWLAGFRKDLEAVSPQELHNHKQVTGPMLGLQQYARS
eukprot:jgi/Chrzof1/678/Cz01g24240.t1